MPFNTAATAAAAPLPNEPPKPAPASLPQTTQPAEYPDVDAYDYGDEDYEDDEDDEDDDDDDDYSSDDGAGAAPATYNASSNAASIYREIPLDFLTNITLQQTRQPLLGNPTTSHLPTPPPTPTASTAPFLTPQQHSNLRYVRTVCGPLPRTYDHIDVRSRQYVPAPRFQYRLRPDGSPPLEEMFDDLAVLYLIYPEHVALFTLMAQTFRAVAAGGGGGGAHMVRAVNALPHLRYLVGLCRRCFALGVGGNVCCGGVIPV